MHRRLPSAIATSAEVSAQTKATHPNHHLQLLAEDLVHKTFGGDEGGAEEAHAVKQDQGAQGVRLEATAKRLPSHRLLEALLDRRRLLGTVPVWR